MMIYELAVGFTLSCPTRNRDDTLLSRGESLRAGLSQVVIFQHLSNVRHGYDIFLRALGIPPTPGCSF